MKIPAKRRKSWSIVTMLALFAIAPPFAHASPTCLPNPSGPGLIAQKWMTHQSQLGCALSAERNTVDGNGRYQDFLKGQIATWSAYGQSSFALLAYVDSVGIHVEWGSTTPYSYDFFLVRWVMDPFDSDGHMNKISGSSTSGGDTIYSPAEGRYRITVEGCDKGVWSSTCNQQWSNPVLIDYKLPDMGFPPAMTLGDVKLDLTGRGDFAARRACQGSLGNFGDNGEDFTMTVSAKLYLAEKQLHCVSQSPPAVILPAAAVSAVNSALASAHPTRHVGTDIGVLETAAIAAAAFAVLGSLLVAVFAIFVPIPLLGGILTVALSAIIGAIVGVSCHTSGDYDMTIRGLIPIMYRYDQFLDPNRSTSPYNPNSTYNHVLDALLSERGGANNIRAHARICGLAVPFVHETENHMLMTETSRYLTNQLLRNRAATYSMGPYPGPADNPDWDNNKNGMKKWLLEELQHFLRADFHEYNARPYERLSVMALQNLRDYALDPEVRLAACNVLDYLAAKYAVSSNELRRAAPFHRRDERGIYTPLYGNYSDEETWRFLFQIGNTDTLLRTRYGHIDPGAIGTMVVSATSTYSVPDVIADLIVDRANIQPYFQRFHHEGVEIYAGGPQYLLSAGGIYNSFYLIPEKSSPLPTTLMPTVDGADRMEFIRIDGNPNAPDRINTCLAPGFACGLNPVIPADIPTACLSTSGLWTFVNFASASGPCDRNYGLFVAMYRVDCTTDACKDAAGGAKTFGFFEVTDTRKPHDSFGAFKAMVLANNPSLQIQSEAVNIYKTTDLRSISFEPNTGDKWKSGIVRIDTATNPQVEPRDIQKWPLADGSRDPLTKQDLWIMKSAQDQNGNETGCVMIENRHMNQRLILDLSNVDEPKRSLVPISSPCRCPLTGDCRLQRCG